IAGGKKYTGLRRILIKKGQLIFFHAPKIVGRKIWPFVRDSCPATGNIKDGFDLLRENTFATHARAELRIVQFSTANVAYAIQHLFLSVWKMLGQPLLK